ncbi:hypothetical protein CEXT_421201 [Caerostris extrusa]|uniref:Uncharacterized protein n=1 Tax=Caerostris extrusa TaxID=172846 RepID=A0AAV4XLB9_CAEEX|nr:hypothetical protein CEXT_421201 [Caerostris extrusa]
MVNMEPVTDGKIWAVPPYDSLKGGGGGQELQKERALPKRERKERREGSQFLADRGCQPRLLTADRRKSVQKDSSVLQATGLPSPERKREGAVVLGKVGWVAISTLRSQTAAIWLMTDGFPFQKGIDFP